MFTEYQVWVQVQNFRIRFSDQILSAFFASSLEKKNTTKQSSDHYERDI